MLSSYLEIKLDVRGTSCTGNTALNLDVRGTSCTAPCHFFNSEKYDVHGMSCTARRG